MKIAAAIAGVAIVGGLFWLNSSHATLSIPHAPHSKIQYNIEAFLSGQHGPNVKCERMCAPEGFESEVETDLEVVTCAGNTDAAISCARLGSQCGKEHRPGCAEYCRDQCCACCSI